MTRMKIYTRTGDQGQTGLIGGQRTDKNDLRMRACGDIDELNAAIGWSAVVSPAPILPLLQTIQSELFYVGATLATPPEKSSHAASLDPSAVARLEREIDDAETHLHPLHNFILPGGGEAAARLHLARAICRRAERQVVALHQERPQSPVILQYINRLSDWLFTHARLANHLSQVEDVIWRS